MCAGTPHVRASYLPLSQPRWCWRYCPLSLQAGRQRGPAGSAAQWPGAPPTPAGSKLKQGQQQPNHRRHPPNRHPHDCNGLLGGRLRPRRPATVLRRLCCQVGARARLLQHGPLPDLPHRRQLRLLGRHRPLRCCLCCACRRDGRLRARHTGAAVGCAGSTGGAAAAAAAGTGRPEATCRAVGCSTQPPVPLASPAPQPPPAARSAAQSPALAAPRWTGWVAPPAASHPPLPPPPAAPPPSAGAWLPPPHPLLHTPPRPASAR